MENENWQKGLRHQLTVNRSFTKAKKCKGAGWYWKLSEYILLLKDVKRIVDDAKMVENTGYFLSNQHILSPTNPKYNNYFFSDLHKLF